MAREYKSETGNDNPISYTPEQIESAIYEVYPSRETYLAKIAKVALHLSVYTRTGRVSWTFQNAIFNRGETNVEGKRETKAAQDDYLDWLLTKATDDEVFPELYRSFGYITEIDRQNFEKQMHIEHAAILKGLQEIVRQCCDSGVCNLTDMSERYDAELFKIGSIFETAARSVCTARRIDFWIPPGKDLSIPDTTPFAPVTQNLPSLDRVSNSAVPSRPVPASSGQDRYISPSASNINQAKEGILTTEPIWKSLIPSQPNSTFPAQQTSNLEYVVAEDRQRSVYESQKSRPDINRNFGVTGQIVCFDVSNLIHNLAVLEKGKLLELPWDGSLLDGELQNEIMDRFRVEIGMRKYFLQTYYQ